MVLPNQGCKLLITKLHDTTTKMHNLLSRIRKASSNPLENVKRL